MIKMQPSVELIDAPDADELVKKIERIGRVCYKSEGKIAEGTAEKFVRNIIKSGHDSVIEHGSISVKVVCDRGVTHEIVRHRVASYSQESTRYCNYSKDKFGSQIAVIDIASGFNYDLNNPDDLKKYQIWETAMENAEKSYMAMLDAGATAQEARSVLPTSTKAELCMTMNLREWRHFFKLRTDKAAHPQMRELAKLIYDAFIEKGYGVFFDDIKM